MQCSVVLCGAVRPPVSPAPLVARRQGRRYEGAEALEEQLAALQQDVGLLELPAVVGDVAPGVHPVVDLQQPLGPLLLGHLPVHVHQDALDQAEAAPQLLLLGRSVLDRKNGVRNMGWGA